MNTTRTRPILAAALVSALAFTCAHGQQVPIPTTAAEVRGPALRAYWPDQPILDGTWKPPVIK